MHAGKYQFKLLKNNIISTIVMSSILGQFYLN